MYPLRKPKNSHFREGTTACSYVLFSVAYVFESTSRCIHQLMWGMGRELSFFPRKENRNTCISDTAGNREWSPVKEGLRLCWLPCSWAVSNAGFACYADSMDTCILWQPGHNVVFFLYLHFKALGLNVFQVIISQAFETLSPGFIPNPNRYTVSTV